MLEDELRGIYHITMKDMRTYYLKPPAMSWGIIFPLTWIFAFYLRNPGDFEDLVPGLLAMTILFSTTAAASVVINFEIRIGALERLFLAPVSMISVLMGKILGGFIFGLMMTSLIVAGCMIILGTGLDLLSLFIIVIPSLLAFSTLGTMFSIMAKDIFVAQTWLNLLRFAMIFMCGVVYPVSALPGFLKDAAYLFPLTYTVDGVRASLSSHQMTAVAIDFLALAVFYVLFMVPAVRAMHKKFE
jgi:ABC-2 type transport system permease protein